VMFLFGTVHQRIASLWCRPWSRMGKKGFRRRLAFALSPSRFPMFVPWLLGLTNPLYLFFLGGWEAQQFALTCLLGYVGVSLLALPFYFWKMLRGFRGQLAIYAAEKVVNLTDTAFAESLLVKAAASPQVELRIAATYGLKELGTPAGMEALGKLCSDRDSQVSVLAMKAYGNVLKVMKGAEIQSLAELPGLIKEYEREKYIVNFKEDWDSYKGFPHLGDLARKIHKIVYSQLLLRRAFPDVFCGRCHAFAVLEGHLDWRWVRCPICQDAIDLKPGIKMAIGTIGAMLDWDLEDGILRVSLWDGILKRAVYAEVASIEIRGGFDIDYDWAVSAVVEMMRNQHHGGEGDVPVVLVGEVGLSVNSLALLGDYYAGEDI
jgi:hypothetical protein